LKHSSASAVRVKIEVMNKVIKMEVRDNGRGEAAIKKGMGIAGMEERTGAAGGKLIIDGSDGFSVITLLPVEYDPERRIAAGRTGKQQPGEQQHISHTADQSGGAYADQGIDS